MNMLQLNGATPLWLAARALLNDRGDDFSRRLEQTLSSFDPEAIHDLRVSSRRMREGLALFAPCYPAAEISRLGRKIKKVTRLLGEIRNRDEASLFFTALRANLDRNCRSEIDRLLADYRQERKTELHKLTVGLKKILASDLCDRYRQVVNFPCLFAHSAARVDLFAPLADFARNNLSARLAVVLELVPPARVEENSAGQHLLRIAVKHFRYRLELLSFILGSSYRNIYPLVKEYQELLGRMHDLDVFAATSLEACFSASAATAIAEAIALERGRLFAQFLTLLTNRSFEKIDRQLRELP